ncbi:MAG TPA: hypothetical protein VF682_01735 [Pseudomonas sp.]|jgi:hypothetical protein
MKARFLPPRVGHYGNLVWRREEFVNKNAEISSSLKKLRSLGYWASAFPEGDGVTFSAPSFTADEDDRDILEDFRNCFDWIDIEQAQSHESNTEIAELETDNRTLNCTIIIPLEKNLHTKNFNPRKVYIFLPQRIRPRALRAVIRLRN